jgi:hypothetical protein
MKNKTKTSEELIAVIKGIATVINEGAIIKGIAIIKDLWEQEKTWENSASNTEHGIDGLSEPLDEVRKKKTKALTQLMSLYLPLANEIADKHKEDGKMVGISAKELHAVAYEAISMEIAKQKWLEPDKDIPSLLKEAATNAINERIEKEREEERNIEILKISCDKGADELTTKEIEDKMDVFNTIDKFESMIPAANGALHHIINTQKTTKTPLNLAGKLGNGSQLNTLRKN